MNQQTMFDQEVFESFVHPGEITEVRIINAFGQSHAWAGEWAKGVVSGYFDDHDAFCAAVQLADQATHGGIYFTLQVIDPRLIGRAFNRLKPSNLTTSDQNVIAYRWLPVDIDPVRPAGISSSDDELAEALAMRDQIIEDTAIERDWGQPIIGMSGNGGHLLFELGNFPNEDATKSFIKSTLLDLSRRYDTDTVKIDQSVFNPARIWKLYGTTAKKGDAVPDGKCREARPHRMAYVESRGSI